MKIRSVLKQELENELNEQVNIKDDLLVILDDCTIEANDYFVFFYATKSSTKQMISLML